MSDNKVKISNILSSLIPDFIETDNALPGEDSLFKQFLNQYYEFEEREYGTTNLADNIASNKNISTLTKMEIVRAQTIPVPNTTTPPDVIVLTSDVFAYDKVINVNHTKGFPDTYGLLKIDDEIISYTGKTDTSFTGCQRGFSGISEIETPGNPEYLTFTDSSSTGHLEATVVVNLGFIYLNEFYKKFKAQYLPGVEDRTFAQGISVENILSRAKDFYTTKGTDISLDILFKVLFGKNVVIHKPFENTIAPSDAEWVNSDNMVVETISGNPLNLKFSTVYQGKVADFTTNFTATGAVANVEDIFLKNKRYHKVYLSNETDNTKFKVNNKTKVTSATNTINVVSVDSTIGFGTVGSFFYKDSFGTYNEVSYTSKSYNQFFGCVGLSTSLLLDTTIIDDNFIFGYENNDPTKVCQMRISGSINSLSGSFGETKYFSVGDEIGVKYLGKEVLKTDKKFNTWITNDVIEYDVVVVDSAGNSGVGTGLITTIDKHTVKSFDKIDIFDKSSGLYLDTDVTVNAVGDNTISYSGNGVDGTGSPDGSLVNDPISGVPYVVRTRQRYVSGNLGLDYLLGDTQNTFLDSEGNNYVMFSGYPSGDITTTDRSKTFKSEHVGLNSVGIGITAHNFLNGEKVYYQPQSNSTGIVGPNGDFSGIATGVYYIQVINDDRIKLSLSRQGIYTNDTLWNVLSDGGENNVGFPTGIGLDEHKLTPYSLWDGIELKNQDNFKRIRKNPKQNTSNGNITGAVGVTLNGIELHSALSEDYISYGQIEQINISNAGKDYDVVNPPNVGVADSSGSGVESNIHLNDGYLSEVLVNSYGWDFDGIPSVTVSGGNGIEVECDAKMKSIVHSRSFGEPFVGTATTIGTINFTEDHRFLDGEEVIYSISDGGTPVGVGSTNSGAGVYSATNSSPTNLVNGGIYYVANVGINTISLAVTKERAINREFLLDFLSDGAGTHTLKATRKRSVLDRVVVKNGGKNFANNRVDVDSYLYPPSTNSGILTTFTGINITDNYVYAKNHNFKNGETVTYSHTGTAISGLSASSYYKVTVVDSNKFKLSEAGTASSITSVNYDNKIYTNLSGSFDGVHTFNYPSITVSIDGGRSVGIGSTVVPSYYNVSAEPIVKGKVSNVFIKRGGVGYGVSTIINHTRQPSVYLQTGKNALIGCIVNTSGNITNAYVVDGGSEYTSPPVLEVIGDGRFARLKANISEGKITSVDIINDGVGYKNGLTSIKVIAAGSDSRFNTSIYNWKINNIHRYSHILNNSPYSTYNDTVQLKSNLREKGNRICSFYVPKKLRYDLNDNLNELGTEKPSDLNHSPIIGWAYDGNPIYGPYGFVNPLGGGGIRRLQSSYKLDTISDDNLRPSSSNYANGYFVNDYFYDHNSADLDMHNGRYIKNDDFPNGTYAYFSSIDLSATPEPSFPYLPFIHYNDTDNFNYNIFIDQSDKYVNTGDYKRNVTDYRFDSPHTNYTFLNDPIDSQAVVTVDAVKSAGITTVTVDNPGSSYKVGDTVSFSQPSYVSGSVKEILGRNVVSIDTSETTINNLKFSIIDGDVTAYSDTPHGYVDSDIIEISGISSSLYNHIEGVKTIGVSTVVSSTSVAIAATAITGITTFISLHESTLSDRFKIGDAIKIGNEQMLILNKDLVNNKYRVARSHNNTTASTHVAGVAVETLSNEFTFKVDKKIKNKNVEFPKKYNFDGELSVGIGSTTFGYIRTIVGTVGVTSEYRDIPEGGIYLPGHKFETGDRLNFVGTASTITYANDRSLTPGLKLHETSHIYAVKIDNDFIGITTGSKIGVSTALGFTTETKYFVQTLGHDHRFETIEDNVTGNSKKVLATVGVDTSHGLSLHDNITLSVRPSLTQDFKFKYNSDIKKVVVEPLGFATSGVSIGSTQSIITITDHNYETGDFVLYTKGSGAIGGLTDGSTYYVIKLTDDSFKLASNSHYATKDPYENIIFTSHGVGDQELSRINPPLEIYRGNTVGIAVSDSSFDNYDINFYYDKDYKYQYNSTLITKTGTFGDGQTSTKISLSIADDFPENLYYRVEGFSTKYMNTYSDPVDTDVPNYANITVLDSNLNKTHRVSGVANTTFEITLVGSAETTSYTASGFTSAFYSTDSLGTSGGIHLLNVDNTLDLEILPKIVSIGSSNGSEAIFSEESSDIGEIQGINVKNQGLEFPLDKTLVPSADSYTILKLKDVYTLESVGIITGGRNYTTPPRVIAIGNSAITTRSTVDGNSVSNVEVIGNDSGISKNIKLIPTVNSNGVAAIGATCDNFQTCEIALRAPILGFDSFPFAVGDEIFVENIGISSIGDGYNSSDYDYRYFKVTAINTTGGRETVSYSIAGIGSTAGNFDADKSFGRVIKKDDLVVLKPNLKKVNFLEGEKITQINATGVGYVVKDGWDVNSQILKLKNTTGIFEEDEKIVSSLRASKSIVQSVYNFDFDYDVHSVVRRGTDWKSDKGKLNFDSQKLHDSDYYQRFSYSVRGEVSYDSWKEPITSLGHISGYKPFADMEISNGIGNTVGMSTFAGDLVLNIEVNSDASVYDRYYHDLVTEVTSNPDLSKVITFGSKVLTDYSESRTNKVLLIDDIANQFTGKTRTFTGQHSFITAASNAISIVSGGSGTLGPSTGTSYDPSTGILTITTESAHGLVSGATISIADNSMTFTCDKDGHTSNHTYPRTTDPASTSNAKLNNGILGVTTVGINTFTVVVNTPIIGGQTVGLTTFALYTHAQESVEPTGLSTERLFYKTIQPGIGISVSNDTFTILDHEFNTGEELIYSQHGAASARIGIATETVGAGTTTFLPEKVYAIKETNDIFKLASSLSNANAGIAVTVTSVGTGNTHTFSVPSESATIRTMISLDNIIQSPLSSKLDVSVGLQTAVGIGTTTIYLEDATSIESNSLIKIQEEYIKVTSVGLGVTPSDATVSLGSTQSLTVVRGVMGSVATAHTVGHAVTVTTGDYRVKDGNIHFVDPPYGPLGIGSLTSRSSFNGRAFYRLNYAFNTVFDDVSEQFDGATTKYMLKKDGNPIVGIETNYGAVLINNIWQDPNPGIVGNLETSNYEVPYTTVGTGSSIVFSGSALNQDLPKGGIINEFTYTPGVGIQSSFRATAIANVSAAGTITSVGIGTSGSGYLFPPSVGIAITNYHYAHRFVSAAVNSVTSAGSTNYTPTYATYESTTGELVLNIAGHGIGTNDTVTIANNSIVFQCSKDGYTTDHAYPRPTDPVAGIQTAITNATTDTITVNVGRGAGIGASFTATIDNGMVTGITVTNPGSGYTSSYQPIIIIDEPSPWKDLSLTGGSGTGAKVDITVGVGGSAIQVGLSSRGMGYSVNDVLTLDPIPYKVGVTTSPFTLNVVNRHQDKFAGWAFGQLLELDSFSNMFNGARQTFLITRTQETKDYFSIVAQKDSGVIIANNLLIFLNDVLQIPVKDYEFTGGTRITFTDPPKAGSKVRMYLYVASRDDYLEVDIDETIKPGDRLRLQEWYDQANSSYTLSQDERTIYELISSDSLETEIYAGIGIRTDTFWRPTVWTKQKSDTVIDGMNISKSRKQWEPKILPSTNIIASVASTDTKIYVKNTHPTFEAYDDVDTSLQKITIVGSGSSTLDTSNIESITNVTYGGDYGKVIGIDKQIITNSGITSEQLKFNLMSHPKIRTSTDGNDPVANPGIKTGDYFVIENTNIGSGVTAVGVDTSVVVSTGSTWINGVYQCYHHSVVGGGSSILEVIANVSSLVGIDTTAILAPGTEDSVAHRNAGTYTWGFMNVGRNVATAKTFTFYNANGIAGISTSAHISRTLGLKSRFPTP